MMLLATNATATVETAAAIALAVLSLAVVIAFIRLARGPSLADRVVALDTIATLLVGMLMLDGIAESDSQLLQVATVLALINFLGTIAFAVYIRGTPHRD
jgi:multicomponent Na+:H+ antiporter subunit F